MKLYFILLKVRQKMGRTQHTAHAVLIFALCYTSATFLIFLHLDNPRKINHVGSKEFVHGEKGTFPYLKLKYSNLAQHKDNKESLINSVCYSLTDRLKENSKIDRQILDRN